MASTPLRMQKSDSKLIFSPSDLTSFLDSEFITWMDRFALEHPGQFQTDPESETDKILARHGLAHEHDILAKLQSDGRDIFDARQAPDRFHATTTAMAEGREVIYQGQLRDSEFSGYPDFLIKAKAKPDSGSALGDYIYEPWDTKLARTVKPKALVQLACYADLLAQIQGVLPPRVVVVRGDKKEEAFRTEDYIYYYRQLRKAFLEQQNNWDRDKSPDFTGMEEFGRWTTHAKQLLEEKDHLCRVANITKVQIKKLSVAGITTMSQLAVSDLARVPKMEPDTLAKLKQQARLQIESKGLAKPKYEVLPMIKDARKGLSTLPPASAEDVFFDMEGYPLIDGGLEYLFGATVLNTPPAAAQAGARESAQTTFHEWWAHDTVQEKRAFEEFVDWAYARWQKDPMMHIFHYASYEKTALRKLMNKYATREKEVDDLLRNEVMVDLFAVVRQSLRVGEPKYSIKNIEHLYKGKREGDVATAMDSVVFYERWIDLQDGVDWKTSEILRDIRAYNKEDCDSTWLLTEWLRGLQREHGIGWQEKPQNEKSEKKQSSESLEEDVSQLAARMLEGIPTEVEAKTQDQRVRELLAYLLEFHWREAKPVHWAKFDRAEMTEEERFEDAGCLAGLVRNSEPPVRVKESYWYHYNFDANQDTKISAGERPFFADDLNERILVTEVDTDNGRAALSRGWKKAGPPDRLSLIKDEMVGAKVIAASIRRTAEALMKGRALPPAVEDFLLRKPPKVSGWAGGALIAAEANLTDEAVKVIAKLEDSTIVVQGPPGSGKTYTAAHAITGLLRAGKRVGIASNSHRAIANLMEKVAETAQKQGQPLRAVKVQSGDVDVQFKTPGITIMDSGKVLDGGYASFDLIGGTAWLFSDERAVSMVDYLFVDEAGQVSIANLIGMAPSASNLVLMGDQMQLAQPLQGTHPGESGQSVLEYLLQEKQVVPDDFGIFLGNTYRMHPGVCSFISGAIYENRLKPKAHTVDHVIELPVSTGPSKL